MERAVAAFPLREVRHGGRARVFSCFCRVWRSGLKNRPPGTEGARHAHRRTLATTNAPNLERQPARQSRPPHRPAGHGRCDNAHRRTLATTNAQLGTTTSSAITPSPTAPPGTEGAPRAPTHACYNQCRTWNDNQLGNHTLPHCPPGTEGAPRAPAHACYNQCRT